jgi:hypothetical protein
MIRNGSRYRRRNAAAPPAAAICHRGERASRQNQKPRASGALLISRFFRSRRKDVGKKSRIIMNRNPRKQHIISQMHLRHFCDRDGDLYVYEKGKEVRKSTPPNEAVKRDYFECKVPGYETNFAVEKMLGRLEYAASKVYKKLLSGERPSGEEAAAWTLYVASLFLRSRKVRDELSPVAYSESTLGQLDLAALKEDQWQIFTQHGRLVSLDDLKTAKSKVLAAFSDPALRQITSLNYSTPNLAGALGTKRWQVVRPALGLHFVTSDAPAVTFCLREGGHSSVGMGWGHEETHVAIPLDPQHLFLATPSNIQWVSPLNEENTIAFMGTMAQFSYRNVYAHTADVKVQELVEQHSGTLIFGRDAYVASVA